MRDRSSLLGAGIAVVLVAAGGFGATRALTGGSNHSLVIDFAGGPHGQGGADGLLPGSDVFMAGAKVGSITDIHPADPSTGEGDDALVTVDIEGDRWPLHAGGLSVDIRPKSLLGEKYVDIHDGDRSGPVYAADASRPLRAPVTAAPVELDQFINSLDDQTRTSARVLLADLGAGVSGRGGDLNRAIQTSRDDLAHLAVTGATLNNRDPELDRILVGLDGVLGRITTDQQLTALSGLIANGRTVLDSIEQVRGSFSRSFTDAQAALTDLDQAVSPAVSSLHDVLAAAPHLLDSVRRESDVLAQLGAAVNQMPTPPIMQAGIVGGPTVTGGALEAMPGKGNVPIFRICLLSPSALPGSSSSCTGQGYYPGTGPPRSPTPAPEPASYQADGGADLATLLSFVQG